MNVLTDLQEWFASNCDGDWEHDFGIRIETMSDPGWMVTIDLEETNLEEMPGSVARDENIAGRSMLVRRAEVFPVECVVRGYLVGSGWKDYLRTGEVCGHKLPEDLLESAELPEPIFTPSTKAEEGHDENITEEQVRNLLGADTAN